MPRTPSPASAAARTRTILPDDRLTGATICRSAASVDPFEFVMASNDLVRTGDVLDIAGLDLTAFQQNPIALWRHDPASPIGTWESLRKVGGQLIGKLRLAAEGTSPLIDRLRKLIEQRILRATSVGFRPLEHVELDKSGRSFGLRFTKSELLECSLVPVPADASALRLRGLALSPLDSEIFAAPAIAPPFVSRGAARIAAPARAPALAPTPTPQGSRAMNIAVSEKITAGQARAIAIDDEVTAITLAAELENNRDYTEDESAQIAALADEKEAIVRSINTNVAIERTLAQRAVAASNLPARVEPTVRNEKPGALLIKMAAVHTMAYRQHRSIDQVCGDLYRDDERVKAGLDYLARTATEIATTQRPGWASELVSEGVGTFLADILNLSVYRALASMGTTLEFGSHGSLVVPRRAARGGLAGAFVGETGVIPVKQDSLTSDTFERYKLAVISTFSKELETLSTPAIENLIRNSISADTSDLIDAKLLSALSARPQVRPAGLLNGVVGVPSSGNTAANINTDIKALFGALAQRERVAVIMHPDRALGLSLVTTATGDYIFKAEIASGKFFSGALIISENVPINTVIAVNTPDFATGAGTPQFELSDQATLTMANADAVAPTQAVTAAGTLDIAEEVGVGLGISVAGGAAGAGTAGYEAVSMFQTWSTALRMVMPISWGMLRAGSVAALTAVNW